MNLLPSITKRTATLIAQGAKCVGFEDAFSYIEESLYVKEGQSVKEFCKWLEANRHRASREMPFIESNFQNLYKNHFLPEIKKITNGIHNRF